VLAIRVWELDARLHWELKMANKFVDYQGKVCADWLNAVDWAVYDALGAPQSPAEARQNLGVVEEAPTDGAAYVRVSASWYGISTIDHNTLASRTAADCHPISAITGLQTSLNGKAPLSHVHTLADITDAGEMAAFNDAPKDSQQYARQNGQWTIVTGGGGGSNDHNLLINRDLADQHPMEAITGLDTALGAKLDDAPIDGILYGRQDGGWTAVSSGGTGTNDHTQLINRDQASQHPIAAITDLQTTLNGKQATITGGATTITTSNLTASRALASDASGKVAVSTVTAAELGHLAGVTGGIQGQLNGKQATITGAATTIDTENLGADLALVSDASGKVATSVTTAVEITHLAGVTGSVQGQLNGKLDDAPNDSSTYARRAASWVTISQGTLDHSQLTNRTIADQHSIGAVTGLQSALDAKQSTITGAASSVVTSNLVASMAMVSDASGKIAAHANVSAVELGYLDGVTSAIQTQFTGKLSLSGGTMSGTLNMNNQQISGAKTIGFSSEYGAGTFTGTGSVTWSNGQKQVCVVGGNADITFFWTGCGTGHYQLRVKQNATGGFTPTFNGIPSDRWIGSSAQPPFNTDANGTTIVTIFYSATEGVICASAAMVGK
jgi:hypothetical protein